MVCIPRAIRTWEKQAYLNIAFCKLTYFLHYIIQDRTFTSYHFHPNHFLTNPKHLRITPPQYIDINWNLHSSMVENCHETMEIQIDTANQNMSKYPQIKITTSLNAGWLTNHWQVFTMKQNWMVQNVQDFFVLILRSAAGIRKCRSISLNKHDKMSKMSKSEKQVI